MSSLANIDRILEWNRATFPALAAVFFLLGPGLLLALRRLRHHLKWLMYAAPLAILLAGLAYNAPYTNDDAYIFFRYADNLAGGAGPYYNPGESCEGYTSPLWLLMLAGAARSVNVVVAAKALGAGLAVLTLALLLLLCRRLGEDDDPMIILTAALIPATSQLFLSWSMSGMDVALFLAWETLLLVFLLRDGAPSIGLWIVTAIGVWIRPEASMILVVGWIWVLWRLPRDRRKWVLIHVLALAAILAAPFIVRRLLYSDWLPNTFYAKSDRTLRNGFGFLLGAVNELGPLVWLLAIAGLWSLRKRYGILLVLVVAFGVTFVVVGGDLLIQRFTLFWLPMLTLGAAAGLRMLKDRLGSAMGTVLVLVAALLCARGAFQAYRVVKPTALPEGYAYVSSNSVSIAETDVPIGRYLASVGGQQERVVTDNIGAVGYYSGMRVIDVNGLTDRTIARLIRAGDTPGIEEYVHRINPEWIICYPAGSADGVPYTLNRPGILGPWVNTEYSPVGTWWSRTGYRRVLLRRN